MLRRDTGGAVASRRVEVEDAFHGRKLTGIDDEDSEVLRTIQDLGNPTRV